MTFSGVPLHILLVLSFAFSDHGSDIIAQIVGILERLIALLVSLLLGFLVVISAAMVGQYHTIEA